MKYVPVLVAVVSLGGGCDVGGGTLAGAGGGTLNTGSGGSGFATGSGGSFMVSTGRGGAGVAGAVGAGGSPPHPCSTGLPAAPLPPDILIVLDTSASMNDAFDGPCPSGCGTSSKWSVVRSAIEAFVSSTPDVNWGLEFLTNGGSSDACAPGYVVVPIGPTNATGIRSQLSRRASAGVLVDPSNTPTRAAIDLAAGHLAAQTSGGNKVIFLVTDGTPDCAQGASDLLASDTAGAVQAIATARTMGFATFVAGVGIAGPAETALTEMALAGGLPRAASPPYYPVSSSADLAAAMSRLVHEERCRFLVPDPQIDDGTLSRSSIDVRIDGTSVPRDPTNGWDYTDASQTAFQLHGVSCDLARDGQTVSVVFRCLLQ